MKRRIGEDIGGGNFAANQRRARNRPNIQCDKCEKPAVAFYSIPVQVAEGEGEMEDEMRCEEHRRDRKPSASEADKERT